MSAAEIDHVYGAAHSAYYGSSRNRPMDAMLKDENREPVCVPPAPKEPLPENAGRELQSSNGSMSALKKVVIVTVVLMLVSLMGTVLYLVLFRKAPKAAASSGGSSAGSSVGSSGLPVDCVD